MFTVDGMDFAAILNQPSELLARQDAWGNTVLRWLVVVATVVVVLLSLRIAKALMARRMNRMAERVTDDWYRAVGVVLRRTKMWFLLILSLFFGASFLKFPAEVVHVLAAVTVVALLAQAALWVDALLMFALRRYSEQHRDVDAASVTTLTALGLVGRLGIWAAAVLLVVANLGIDVTAMIAGLGIGGVAVALAAQNILGDLFASASIVLDKPFVLGDFIVVDDKMGSVEYIGLKTTRLRSISGEQLVFSNADLLKSRIHNYKRMSERRARFTVDVAYDTPCEKLAAISDLLAEVVKAQPQARFERAHFAKFGELSLVFEIVYYVTSADYLAFMDTQQAINLAIVRRFAEMQIGFAFSSLGPLVRQPITPTLAGGK